MYKEKYDIREIKETEINMLETMLYEAIYQPIGSEPLTKDIIKIPEIKVYIDNFLKKKDDYCLVAEINGDIVGAVWVRILAGKIKGYGNIDDKTPEFTVSLIKEYRNQGIGTSLMKKMIEYLEEKKYRQASLSVSKDNYAVKMYKKLGFEIIAKRKDDFLMLLKLI